MTRGTYTLKILDLWEKIWDKQDIVIVEGRKSRLGVGNDLFSNCNSIKRILCPSINAFSKYDIILNECLKQNKNTMFLIALGPTASVLSYDLANKGFRSLDIGHIDSEYEWYKMGAVSKVKLPNKHTAEFNYDENIVLDTDERYESQIVAKVGI